MTLAFALRGSDGLVLGSDSRSSSPEGSTDTSTKFLQINREIGVLTYGLTEVGYKGINRLYNEVNRTTDFDVKKKRVVYLSDITDMAKQIFKETYDEWLSNELKVNKGLKPDDPQLITGFILGGYDANETNQFKIFYWRSPEFEREERPVDIIAAQWSISQYLSNHFYYSEMNVEQLKRLAVFMLIETEMTSNTVGGQLQIATVTIANGFQRLNEQEIRTLINENQSRFAKFRKVLLERLRP